MKRKLVKLLDTGGKNEQLFLIAKEPISYKYGQVPGKKQKKSREKLSK